MDPETEKIIEEQMKKLPEAIRNLFLDEKLKEKIAGIGKRNGLTMEQLKLLETETYLVMIGLVHTEEYKDALKEQLGVEDEKLSNIVSDINKEILDEVKEILADVYEAEDELEELPSNEDIEETLDQRFDKLPEEVKKAVVESGYHDKLYAIGEKNNLNVIQMGKLEETATNVVIGNIHPDKFEEKLKEKLGTSGELTKNIAGEINTRILAPIREKMEVAYEKTKAPSYEIKPEIKAPSQIGIKIIRPEINAMELKAGNKAEAPSVSQTPKTNPIMMQKLSGSFQAPTVKTDYSMKPASDTTKKNMADPYRELPE